MTSDNTLSSKEGARGNIGVSLHRIMPSMSEANGILPIAKSTNGEKVKPGGGIDNNQVVVYGCLEGKEKEEWNLLCSECSHEGIKEIDVSQTVSQEMDAFKGRAEPSFGVGGWSLPGHGEAYWDCGSLRYRGCLNVLEHHGSELYGPNREGKAYVQVYRRSCARKECPKCYEAWAGKEASRAVYRIDEYGKRRGVWWRAPIHVVASPCKELWGFEYPELRRKLYALLKRAGIRGGSVIFHPYRIPKSKHPFLSPHFHVIGFGWLNSYRGGGKWVLKNLRVRKSLHATLMYQLSHAGVHEAFHSITWFGSLAYNKLKIEPFQGEGKPTCPLCGAPLIPLDYIGSEGPPEVEDEYWLPGEDWVEKIGRFG